MNKHFLLIVVVQWYVDFLLSLFSYDKNRFLCCVLSTKYLCSLRAGSPCRFGNIIQFGQRKNDSLSESETRKESLHRKPHPTPVPTSIFNLLRHSMIPIGREVGGQQIFVPDSFAQ